MNHQGHPNGTVAFLFTDIEGSTKLAREHPEQWEALRQCHHAILRSAADGHQGYVFQIIGDAFCVAFHSARDAIDAALQAQQQLLTQDWGNLPVKVRMGIHTGKADVRDDGQYVGYLTLSRVQRVMSVGHGGQTLLSQVTQELVRDELPEQVSLRDLGEHRLKDMLRTEHIYQVDMVGLPNEFPRLKTLDVQLNNLPTQLTPFVGREREVAAVSGLLRNPNVRLLTLTGAGGTGKTRLSLQVAAELVDENEHGVWFVELATITDPDLVLPSIASVLKVKESAGLSIAQGLENYLHDKNLLFVLDNFEQVVNAAPLMNNLLNGAPKIKILVSSREVLRLRGEHNYPVPPLGLPETRRKQTAAVLAQYEAIALFVQHARAANPAFELNEENASSVAEICAQLDGLPLAIELAAARSRLLKPATMLDKLNSRLNLLTSGARDLPQRQQTIRGAIDWSYDLLDEVEKTLFIQLGVFTGGWTLEAAEAICNPGLSGDILSGLESLLDKSLLRQYEGKSGETRFTMLETIREYALEKLTQSGELARRQQAHADFMDQMLEKVIGALSGPKEVAWFARLDDELDNLRSAVDWALEHQQLSLIFKISRVFQYWSQRSIYREPLQWLERGLAIEAGGTPEERARVMATAGNLILETGNIQLAREYYESALALYRQIGDDNGIAISLNNLGNIAWKEKDFNQARQMYEQCLVIGREPNSWGHSMLLNNLGSLARIRGDWQAALDYYTQSREICQQLGAETGVSYADWFLGILALAQRKLAEAQKHFQNQLKAAWLHANPVIERFSYGYLGYVQLLLGNKVEALGKINDSLEAAREYIEENPIFESIWFLLDGKARLVLDEGKAERAAQLFGAAWRQRMDDDFPLTEAEQPDYEACIAKARSALGDAAFDEAFRKGQAMSVKEAIAFALEDSQP